MLRRRSKDNSITMVNVKETEQANHSPQKESSQSEEEQQHSIRFLFLDFCSYTSGHGPGRIVASRYWIMKIFWFLLFVAALVLASIQIDALFAKFKRRPLTTHVSIQHETSLNFPSITICNFNALRKDALGEAAQELRESFETIENETLNFDAETKRERRPVNDPEDDYDGGTSLEDFSEEDEEGIENPDALDLQFKHKEQFLSIMAHEGPIRLIPLGHQFEDLILSCRYRGISCENFTSSFWSGFWHYSYGNCFVFNAGKSDKGKKGMILKSNKPGPSHGLVLELNIEQNQYIGAFTEEAGIKVDISNQGEMPFPREKGLSAAPGFAASIGMRKVEINRKDPFNNNRCRNIESLDDSNLYNQFGVNYSSTACKESCLALNQRSSCNCMEHRFPIPSDATAVCDIFNKTVVNCLSRVQRDFKNNKLNCTNACPPPCRENIFKVTASFASWPSKSNEPFYLNKLEKKKKLVDNGNNVSLNFLQLNIFYEELNFELIKEELSYELANFVSDIGGTLGLWIGMSVLSFAEILEVLLLIGNELIRKCLKKKPSSTKVQSSSPSFNF